MVSPPTTRTAWVWPGSFSQQVYIKTRISSNYLLPVLDHFIENLERIPKKMVKKRPNFNNACLNLGSILPQLRLLIIITSRLRAMIIGQHANLGSHV